MASCSGFGMLTEHDVAAIFARVVAMWPDAALNARDACALRSTCTLAVRGYDCAVHAGWVPIAGHRSDAPAEAGATCEWVSGWFPMRLWGPHDVRSDRGGDSEDDSDDWADGMTVPELPMLTLRVEHRLLTSLLVASQNFSAATFPCLCRVILCETLRREAYVDAPSIFDSPVLSLAGLTSLRIDPPATDTEIGADFMPHCDSLRSFDASRMSAVVSIGDDFLLSYAPAMRAFDTKGLTALTELGSSFLSAYESLTSFDTAGLTALRSFGSDFMCRCTALKAFDASPLTHLTAIPDFCLCDSSSLTSFDASGLTAVTSIGDSFLQDACSLTAFDTSGLTSVICIGKDFMSGASLATFNAEGLTSVTSIESGFLFACANLKAFDDGGGLALLRDVGTPFLGTEHVRKSIAIRTTNPVLRAIGGM